MAKNSRPVAKKSGFGWLGALFFVLLGCFLTLAVPIVLLLFVLPKATPGTELNLPSSGGRPDLSVQISQDYINRELKTYLTKNPVKVGGVAELKGVVIEFQDNSIVQLTNRVSFLTGEFDIQIRENVRTQNGKVVLSLADALKIQSFAIPTQVANLVFDEVNKIAANSINEQIAKISEPKESTPGTSSTRGVVRQPRLLSVRTQAGILSAEVDISLN